VGRASLDLATLGLKVSDGRFQGSSTLTEIALACTYGVTLIRLRVLWPGVVVTL